MGQKSIQLATVLVLLAAWRAAGEPQAPRPIAVPEGNGTPVITDGIFSPGEWDDALKVPVRDGAEMRLKQFRGVVFIGVRSLSRDQVDIGPSELLLAVPGGPIHKLHVSAQLYEAVLPTAGPEPRPSFGLTTDWYANELRQDMEAAQRLQQEGKNPFEIIRATSYPSDGIEFAIRRTRFPGERWLMRLWVSAFVENKPGMFVYPAAAAEKTTEKWLELRFP